MEFDKSRRCSVGHFTDDCGAPQLIFNRGYQVLHPLRNSTGQGSNSRQCERVEWCRRVASSVGARRRYAGAASAVGAKFRPGLGRHQDTSLGPVALILSHRFLRRRLSPSGLPSLHRKSAFSSPGVKPWAFFCVRACAERARSSCLRGSGARAWIRRWGGEAAGR
jgi:hypothetical protein